MGTYRADPLETEVPSVLNNDLGTICATQQFNPPGECDITATSPNCRMQPSWRFSAQKCRYELATGKGVFERSGRGVISRFAWACSTVESWPLILAFHSTSSVMIHFESSPHVPLSVIDHVHKQTSGGQPPTPSNRARVSYRGTMSRARTWLKLSIKEVTSAITTRNVITRIAARKVGLEGCL